LLFAFSTNVHGWLRHWNSVALLTSPADWYLETGDFVAVSGYKVSCFENKCGQAFTSSRRRTPDRTIAEYWLRHYSSPYSMITTGSQFFVFTFNRLTNRA